MTGGAPVGREATSRETVELQYLTDMFQRTYHGQVRHWMAAWDQLRRWVWARPPGWYIEDADGRMTRERMLDLLNGVDSASMDSLHDPR